MQQSSATQSLHLSFWGVAEDCCMLSLLLAVPSCIYSFWHGVIPTSYFIFILVYKVTLDFLMGIVFVELSMCLKVAGHILHSQIPCLCMSIQAPLPGQAQPVYPTTPNGE